MSCRRVVQLKWVTNNEVRIMDVELRFSKKGTMKKGTKREREITLASHKMPIRQSL